MHYLMNLILQEFLCGIFCHNRRNNPSCPYILIGQEIYIYPLKIRKNFKNLNYLLCKWTCCEKSHIGHPQITICSMKQNITFSNGKSWWLIYNYLLYKLFSTNDIPFTPITPTGHAKRLPNTFSNNS